MRPAVDRGWPGNGDQFQTPNPCGVPLPLYRRAADAPACRAAAIRRRRHPHGGGGIAITGTELAIGDRRVAEHGQVWRCVLAK